MSAPTSTTKLADGIYFDLSRDDYDRITDRVNWSTLKHLWKSPAHYEHVRTKRDDEDTDARKRGRAVHLAVFEPERFRSTCVVYEGTRRGNAWDAFVDRNPDSEILTPAMHEAAVAIGRAARSSAMAAPYLSNGKSEVTLLWTHVVKPQATLAGFSIACKARLDFIANCEALVDLKSTKDASPEGFARAAANYQMHVQAAWYRDAYETLTGKDWPYLLVATEASAPYVTQVYRVGPELLEMGREIYQLLMGRLNLCRSENFWPGYGTSPMDLTLPRWAMPRDQEDVADLDLVFG